MDIYNITEKVKWFKVFSVEKKVDYISMSIKETKT